MPHPDRLSPVLDQSLARLFPEHRTRRVRQDLLIAQAHFADVLPVFHGIYCTGHNSETMIFLDWQALNLDTMLSERDDPYPVSDSNPSNEHIAVGL